MLKRSLSLLLALVLVTTGFVLGWKLRPPIHDSMTVVRTVYKTQTLRLKGKETIRTVYVPQEGSVSVEPKDPTKPIEDVVTIKVKTWGLTARPGLSYDVVNRLPLVDIKLGYMKRLSAGLNLNSHLQPGAFVSYRLDGMTRQVLINTELVLGYRISPVSLPWWMGVRLNL